MPVYSEAHYCQMGSGLAGSSFLDVLHDVGNGTICIFRHQKRELAVGVEANQTNIGMRQKTRLRATRSGIYILEVRP